MRNRFNFYEFCEADADQDNATSTDGTSRRLWRGDGEGERESWSWWGELSAEEKEEEILMEEEARQLEQPLENAQRLEWEEARTVAREERLRRWIYGGLTPPPPLTPASAP